LCRRRNNGRVDDKFATSSKSKWLWIGATLSILIFLPNLIWQVQHDFVSLDFLRHIYERVRIGQRKNFLPDELTMNLLAAPLGMLVCIFISLTEWRRPGDEIKAAMIFTLADLVGVQGKLGEAGSSSQIGTSSFVSLTGLIFKFGILHRIPANERCLQARFEPHVRVSGVLPW
jgi:hypothetical protein